MAIYCRHSLPGHPRPYLKSVVQQFFDDTQSNEAMVATYQAIDGHPLSLHLLSGCMQTLEQDWTPWTPLLQMPNREACWQFILEKSYQLLPEISKLLLGHLATLGRAVTLEMIVDWLTLSHKDDVITNENKPSSVELFTEEQACALLQSLQVRGVVYESKDAGEVVYYDIHPLIRRFVNKKMQQRQLSPVTLSNPQTTNQTEQNVPEANPLQSTIDLYKYLIQAGRYEDAFILYRERLSQPLYMQLGDYQQEIVLLTKLFPDGVEKAPRLPRESQQAWVLNSLAGGYMLAAMPAYAVTLFQRSNTLYERLGHQKAVAIGLSDIARGQIQMGALQAADQNLRRSIVLCRQNKDRFQEATNHQLRSRLMTFQADWSGAAIALDKALELTRTDQHLLLEAVIWLQGAFTALINRKADTALRILEQAQSYLKRWPYQEIAMTRAVIQQAWLQGWACWLLGEREKAATYLHEAWQQCEVAKIYDLLPSILLSFAHFLAGDPNQVSSVEQKQTFLTGERQKAWQLAGRTQRLAKRAGYKLVLADIHLLFAQLANKDEGAKACFRAYCPSATLCRM